MGEGVGVATWVIDLILLSAQNYGDTGWEKVKFPKFLLIDLITLIYCIFGWPITQAWCKMHIFLFSYFDLSDMSLQQAKYESIRYGRSCLNIGSKMGHKIGFLGALTQRDGQTKLFAHWVGGGHGWLWWPPKMVARTAYTEAGERGQNSLNRNLGKLWVALVPHQRACGTQNFMWMYHGGMVPK